MKSKLILGLAFSFSWISLNAQNCDINATATPSTITCGQSAVLTAFGSSAGQVVLDEDFNSGGFGPGWGSTPGATSFNNPCSPGGVDGTPHAWMDNNTSVPRTLTSASYDLTAATAGVSVCFDLLFAEQGDAAPCEGPDEPDEGVYLQYSTDGGNTWIDIHYFDPNGGNDPQLTNWNNWCFELPPGAITSNTQIRWHQTADSGADFDHWGIDNVQIFQNDINAEVEWLHDGYSYGVGNPGGDNPTPVSPITTTTYTAQITTGTGDVCTADVTVIVVDPVYDVNVSANPTTICAGDCADITGTAQIVLDPGGIETYENNQTEVVVSGGASVNINIQTLNMTGVNPGSIQEICINGFNFSGSELCTDFLNGCNCNGTQISFGDQCNIDASSFNITVTSPNGCEITLVPANTIVTTGIQDMCFVPSGGAPIASGSGNYSGQFNPTDPISNLDGCDANGVWTLEFNTGTGGFGFGFGSLTGWNITFDDPPVYAPVDISWSPTTDLSNPNSINTQACPTNSTDYELTVSTGTPGCEVHTETVSIVVDPCGGCIPPNVIVNPLNACAPANLDLTSAIDASSAPATITYHGNQADAQNDVNTVGTSVSSSGSYWVRYEDPSDPTCFGVREIVVTISTAADASFTLTDFCEGTANSASNIATLGGTFAFNPVPGGGVTIDPSTGEISNGVSGTQYTVEYSINSGCPSSSTENVTVNANPTPVITGALQYCVGSSTTLSTTSTYSDYLWTTGSTNQSTTATTADNPITVEVEDANGCVGTSAPVNLSESTEIVFDDQIEICQGENVSIHGVTQSTPGVYSTTLPSASGCDSIANITLVVNPLPTPVITGNLFYCPGETTILNAGGPYNSYNWSIGGNQQTINATAGTGITVTVTDANGCSGTSTPVTVASPVNAVITATPNSGGDPLDVVLSNGSTNASNYFWDFGNGNTFNTNNLDSQNQTYSGEDSFTVMLVAEENGCTDTAYVTISLNNPMVIEIPNVFTPNGDLANDVFFFNSVGVATLEITILNRWGNLVFESDDVNFFWNGKTANGQDAKEGVYFFKYQATGFDGTSQEGHGFVTLER